MVVMAFVINFSAGRVRHLIACDNPEGFFAGEEHFDDANQNTLEVRNNNSS